MTQSLNMVRCFQIVFTITNRLSCSASIGLGLFAFWAYNCDVFQILSTAAMLLEVWRAFNWPLRLLEVYLFTRFSIVRLVIPVLRNTKTYVRGMR